MNEQDDNSRLSADANVTAGLIMRTFAPNRTINFLPQRPFSTSC